MKKLLALCLALMMALSLCACAAYAADASDDGAWTTEEIFADWNDGAPALGALIDYVEAVTDESSPDYIPPVDRIAVFDMDGTLCAELCPAGLAHSEGPQLYARRRDAGIRPYAARPRDR